MSKASVDHFCFDPDLRDRDDQRAAPLFRRPKSPADGTSSDGRRASLGSETASRAPPVEISFLLDHGVPRDALNEAAALARRQGVSADAALLAEGLVEEKLFYRALAQTLGVAFIDEKIELAPGALATAGLGYVRLRDRRDGVRWLFAPSGTQIFRLKSVARAAKGRPFSESPRARASRRLCARPTRELRCMPRVILPNRSTAIFACGVR